MQDRQLFEQLLNCPAFAVCSARSQQRVECGDELVPQPENRNDRE